MARSARGGRNKGANLSTFHEAALRRELFLWKDGSRTGMIGSKGHKPRARGGPAHFPSTAGRFAWRPGFWRCNHLIKE